MSGVVEALHIYDERNPILSHTYTSRPLSAPHVVQQYLLHPQPRPNLLYLPNANPPTLVFSLTHADLLLLATTSSEIEPLLVLEFLHRVVDAFEEFLGAPLSAQRIEGSYDVVAQLLTEMCDAGLVSTTEPNALRDLVEVEGFVGRILGSIQLPGKPGLTSTPSTTPSLLSTQTPSLPWRRANVRHTSNELYADVVETLSVTLAPSGRPLSAFANGTIAFTSKVSGVPDMTMTLTGPSGNKHNLSSIIELPVFHPCVRLNRWRERPGELSFVPPDGRFILAGYEVDLLPFTNGKSGSLGSNALKLPVSLDVKTGLGTNGADFEVRLQLNRNFSPGGGQFGTAAQHGRSTSNTGGVGGGLSSLTSSAPKAGTAAAPLLEDLTVTIPLPAEVRNLSEIRPTKGDAAYSPGDRFLEWHISNKELGSGGTSFFGLRCTVVGQIEDDDTGGPQEDEEAANMGLSGFAAYDDTPYQAADDEKQESKKEPRGAKNGDGVKGSQASDEDAQAVARNKVLMPSSASLSFAVKGWLPSGIKVESILIDTRKSRGLAEAVKPYKGVKYLTVSKRGVEIRC